MKPQVLFTLLLLLVLVSGPLWAQQRNIDSLQHLVNTLPENDTSHIRALISISERCIDNEPVRGRAYLDAALRLARKYGFKRGIAAASLGIGKYHIDRQQLDSALWYVRRGLVIYEEVRWAIGLGNAHNFLGMIYSMRGEHREALAEFTEAARIYEQIGRRDRLAHALGNSGVQYHDRGIFDSAATVFERALRIYEEVGDKRGVATQSISLANTIAGDSLQMVYYTRAHELFTEIGNIKGANSALYHIGLIQLAAGEKTCARKTLQQVIEQAEQLRDPVTLVNALNALGNMHRADGDTVRAIENYEQALSIANTSTQTRVAALIHVNLGRIYLGASNCFKAVENAESGLQAARAVGDRETEHLALLLLANIEQLMGNPAAALEHHRLAYALRDSIHSEKSAKHTIDLLAKYEADKREKELRLLKADQALKQAELARGTLLAAQQAQQLALLARERDVVRLTAERTKAELALEKETALRNARETALLVKENQLQGSVLAQERQLRNSVLGGIALLVLAALLGYKRMNGLRLETALRAEAAEYKARAAEAQSLALAAETEKREKQAQQEFSRRLIELQEQERKRISSELHDSLGQELTVIRNHAMLALKANGDTAAAHVHLDEVMNMASAALTDVRQISRALRPYQIDELGLAETVRSMLRGVAKTSALQLHADIGDIDDLLQKDAEITLFRLVQESVTNALKHAEATELSVHVARVDKDILLNVCDNGRGFDLEALQAHRAEHGSGLGLRSMRERVSMLGGVMDIRSARGQGTRISICIPVRRETIADK